MRKDYIPFAVPDIGEAEIEAVTKTLRKGWISTGPQAAAFEKAFARTVGSASALAVNSCTAALQTALRALDVSPENEVITSTLTFVSTVNVIEHLGARPVLVDVEPDTLNLDPEKVEAAITPRTKAIIPVHFAGHPADLDSIREIANRHKLAIIEDAAHALGALYQDEPIGASENMVAFSFYTTKNITTADGGMLTGHQQLIERARRLSLHGMSTDAWKRYSKHGSWFYEVHEPGYKVNMNDLTASLGLAQLVRLTEFQDKRRKLANMYLEGLKDCEAIELPVERPDVLHAWHLFPIRLRLEKLSINRDSFIQKLADRNIGTSVHFIPVHRHDYYQKTYQWQTDAYPVAEGAYQRLLSLPLYPLLTETDCKDVIETVKKVLRDAVRG